VDYQAATTRDTLHPDRPLQCQARGNHPPDAVDGDDDASVDEPGRDDLPRPRSRRDAYQKAAATGEDCHTAPTAPCALARTGREALGRTAQGWRDGGGQD